ncbi:MAG: hypothetical protein ACAF41_32585 [Leptolyngbya sp. BL-A-14]
MGVNTVTYLDHSFDIHQLRQLDQILTNSIKPPLGIIQCLNERGEQFNGLNRNSWVFEVPPEDKLLLEGYTLLDGPEGLGIYLGMRIVYILVGARWRGFYSIESWRKVHLEIIERIGRVLGSSVAIWAPDYSLDLISEEIGEELGFTTIEEVEELFCKALGKPLSVHRIGEPVSIEDTEAEGYSTTDGWYIQRYS